MRILIVQLGRIGDAILSSPVFRAVKNKYPDCIIDVIAGKAGSGALRSNPFISRIFILDKSPVHLIKFIRDIRHQKYDFHIDAKDHYSTESKILAKLTRSDRKVGFKPDGSNYFTDGIPSYLQNENTHYAERCFIPLGYLNIFPPTETPHPDLFISEDSKSYTENFLKNIPENFVVINISASMPRKMWKMEKWTEFLNRFGEHYHFCISSAPQERHTAEQIKAQCRSVSLFRSRNIEDVFALVEKSRLVISPDTSIVHIAAAFDKPLIGLYAGLDDFFRRFHPLSTKQIVVSAPENFDGIEPIDVSELAYAFKKMVSEINL